MRPQKYTTASRGTTLLEMIFAMAILAVVLVVIQQSITSAVGAHSAGETQLALESTGRDAIARIAEQLRQAGIEPNPADPANRYFDYPYIWEGNNPAGIEPNGPYDSYALPNGEQPIDVLENHYSTQALASDPAVGASRSIAFLTPSLDGSAVLDDNGEELPLAWDSGELATRWGPEKAIYLKADANGEFNNLVLYDSATGQEAILCRHVERVLFENYIQGTEVMQNQVRIRLYLRRQNAQGKWLKADLSSVVSMRSSQTN